MLFFIKLKLASRLCLTHKRVTQKYRNSTLIKKKKTALVSDRNWPILRIFWIGSDLKKWYRCIPNYSTELLKPNTMYILYIMSDTCATHRSRVPRRSSGRIKGGATTVEDERGPGLDFNLCFVCGSRPWGAAALLLSLLICLLNFFKCSPVPASFFPIYELCYNIIHYNKNITVLMGL